MNRIAYLQPEHFDFIYDHYRACISALRSCLAALNYETPTSGTSLSATRVLFAAKEVPSGGFRNSELTGARQIEEYAAIGTRAYYLQAYIDDMTHFGYASITQEFMMRFQRDFANPAVLSNIAEEALARITVLASGQVVIGENTYTIHNNKVYYRSLIGYWHEVRGLSVFLLLPTLYARVDMDIVAELESAYHPTRYDRVYLGWSKKKWQEKIPEQHFLYCEGSISPEEYSKKTVVQIKTVLQSLPSLKAIRTVCAGDESRLEALIKVSYKILQFVTTLRERDAVPLYILRDGMLFGNAHEALNILSEVEKPYREIMVGRSLLSAPGTPEQYWSLAVDVLFDSLLKYPNDFQLFYQAYCERMQSQEKEHPELQELFARVSAYLEHMLAGIAESSQITMVDTGLQGSVNMLLKYLRDQQGYGHAPSDITMYVVGDWFRNLYREKFASDYYPMMKDIEILSRSEEVYRYVPESFQNGRLEVAMGSHEAQTAANCELFVMLAVAKIMQEDK